jgi:hypothetical protein
METLMQNFRLGFSFAVLLLVAGMTVPTLAATSSSSSRTPDAALATAPEPLFLTGTCTAQLRTAYYSDAAHTNQVGLCRITCTQWDLGSEEPVFGGGGVCTGTESAYTVPLYSPCPCPH